MIQIPRDTIHQFIHRNMSKIPVPDLQAAEDVLDQLDLLTAIGLISNDDPLETRLRLLAGLFDLTAQPTANALRRQLDIVHRFKNEPP